MNGTEITASPSASDLRHYWRCPSCLSIIVTLGDRRATLGSAMVAECSICDRQLDYMGKVYIDRLVKFTSVCACNEKCQSATGPNCCCECGGLNHGVAMYHDIISGTSAIPKILPMDCAAATRRDEYRAARDAAKERIGWAFATLERTRFEFVSDASYWSARHAIDAYNKAVARAQHGPRLKALASVGAGSRC